MEMWAWPSVFSMGACVLLAGFIVWQGTTHVLFFPLLWVMGVMVWIHGVTGLSAFSGNHFFIWNQGLLLGEVWLPVALGYACQSLLQKFSSHPGDCKRGWWNILTGGAVIFTLLLTIVPEFFLQAGFKGETRFLSPGGGIWLFVLTGMFLVIIRLEHMFRSFRDPLRHRLQYVLVGLTGLAVISLGQAFYMLLFPVWSQDVARARGLAAIGCLFLLGLGMGRWQGHFLSRKIRISHQAWYTSLAAACIGGYLIVAGLMAVVIQQTGWEVKEYAAIALMTIAGSGLIVIMLSRQVRAEFRYFVLRHFFTTKYDYREQWLQVMDTFAACKNDQEIWNCYLAWLSRTFGVSRITIWKYFEVDGRYHQIRKERRRRLWEGNEPLQAMRDAHPIPDTHPLVLQLKMQQEPLMLREGQQVMEDWESRLSVIPAQVCVPLVTGDGTLLGFCTLSQPSSGKEYDPEDIDLLRVMAHHVTMLLLQFHLIQERSTAAKWEAVHRFSAFYLHDLKNLAGSLSLLVQNVEQYSHDPDFQTAAIRSMKATSQRILDLMRELARQAKQPDLQSEPVTESVDINLLIRETVAAVESPGCVPDLHPGLEVPWIPLKVESVKQVLLNVILNACQATGENGRIDIFTGCDGERVIVEVIDTGSGMSMSQLENLFQPFTSSKPHGLGVGLFQCKRIVEDHYGQIHIESREGQGTTVIIIFPVAGADKVKTAAPGLSNVGTACSQALQDHDI